ncbi:MAG TPA: KipI antagonist, partial [Candidatus Caenarcaniphilales bacterium]|nr:KipI antagonist [Candidatus Caenarcaniphilales bacterium]
ARSDRQGIRLEGPALEVPEGAGAMLSQGVVWGAVQVPPDGQPICLLADHQTVGGYPVVAVVATVDRPVLGQLGPGDPVSFSLVSVRQAQQLAREQTRDWHESAVRWRQA